MQLECTCSFAFRVEWKSRVATKANYSLNKYERTSISVQVFAGVE